MGLVGIILFTVLTAQSLVQNAYLSSMLTRLQAKLALVAVADAVIATDRLKFCRTSRALTYGVAAVFRADCAPLAYLQTE